VTPERNKSWSVNLLRTLALTAVEAGAVGSFGLMLYAGGHNPSVLLVVLFAGWVLSPFMALLVANAVAKRWSILTRVTLYSLMLVIPLGSLVGYSGVLSPPGTKPAFVFLVVPLVSWLLMTITIPIAASLSRKLSRRNEGV
jgi:hypothetical protein